MKEGTLLLRAASNQDKTKCCQSCAPKLDMGNTCCLSLHSPITKKLRDLGHNHSLICTTIYRACYPKVGRVAGDS